MKSGKLFINGSLVIQEEDGLYRHVIKNKFEQILEQKKERLNEDKITIYQLFRFFIGLRI